VSGKAFDVVIAGGGLAGLAVALQLARAVGVSVAVIDPHVRRPRFGETLSPACRPVLAQLGVLDAFIAGPHARCAGTMASWGSDEVHYNDYILHPEGYGWRVDRDALEAVLAREAAEHGVAMLAGTFNEVTHDGDELVVGTANGLRARVVVDATARSAVAARKLGARKIVEDRLVGIAGVFDASATVERDYPLIEACEKGWLYSSLMPAGGLAVVVMTDSDVAHDERLHDEVRWRELIASSRNTSRRVHGAHCLVAPSVASACSQRIEPIAGNAWIAVGDAASAFDPLSSMGITKALSSAIAAGAAIDRHLGGDRDAFSAYARSVAVDYARYLETRTRYYTMEQRWPSAPFWRRRLG
jgi:2-polyprenyl-6-methoxyphenol hydroxylase-like FAD-dependent oxidoreductase